MTSKSPVNSVHCPGRVPSNYDRALLTPPPERHSQLTRQRGGLISIPGKLKPPMSGASRRLTKLLLNVTIQHSFGPVQVVTSPENTVGDLIKEALAIYVKEKRRPLVKQTNPECFELHYSQFSLESLKTGEKLINLGSRNFFCVKSLPSLSIHLATKKLCLCFPSPSSWIFCFRNLLPCFGFINQLSPILYSPGVWGSKSKTKWNNGPYVALFL